MIMLIRKKLALILIAIYWPALFVATHIPMPQVIKDLDINDKGLHFVAYFTLVFLCWGVVSPYTKVNWRSVRTWLILAIVVWYGIIDEWLQHYSGRLTETSDFMADLGGAVSSLVILSFMPFLPATLLLSSMAIFILANCARADITKIIPVTNNVFHLIAYSSFTMLWLWNVYKRDQKKHIDETTCHWLLLGIALPVFLLAGVKIASYVLNRYFGSADVIYSLIGIFGTLALSLAIGYSKHVIRTPRPRIHSTGAQVSGTCE